MNSLTLSSHPEFTSFAANSPEASNRLNASLMLSNLVSIDPAATMSSRDLAKVANNKRHDHVMRDIRVMLKQLGEDPARFGGYYIAANGKRNPEFNLPKNLSITLIAGYDVHLCAYIVDRWMELEAQAAQRAPLTFSEALLLAAAKAEQVEQQQMPHHPESLTTK